MSHKDSLLLMDSGAGTDSSSDSDTTGSSGDDRDHQRGNKKRKESKHRKDQKRRKEKAKEHYGRDGGKDSPYRKTWEAEALDKFGEMIWEE